MLAHLICIHAASVGLRLTFDNLLRSDYVSHRIFMLLINITSEIIREMAILALFKSAVSFDSNFTGGTRYLNSAREYEQSIRMNNTNAS